MRLKMKSGSYTQHKLGQELDQDVGTNTLNIKCVSL